MKTCARCKTSKPVAHYWREPKSPDGRSYVCRACNAARLKARYRALPRGKRYDLQKHREYWRKKNYGVEPKQYAEMYAAQQEACAICGTHDLLLSRTLCVDHDHATGAVRGLLCDPCNQGLGAFKDSADLLLAAAAYLGRRAASS